MKIPFVGGVLIALVLAGAASSGYAASFSADLIVTRGATSQTGVFNFHDKSYRCELVENGQKLWILFDAKTGITRLVNPAEKSYYQGGPEDPLGRMSTPFGFYDFAARQAQTTVEGSEKIAGVDCAKQVLAMNGQEYARAWYSNELGVPLKVIVPIFQQTAELKNIQRGPQDATLFTVPADYKLVEIDSRPPAPEWADQVPTAPLLTAPFERTLREGEIVRLRLQPGQTIRVVCTNGRKEPSAFTTVGFKGGRPTSDLSGNTMNLSADDEVTSAISKSPGEVDHYIIRVGIGVVKLKATIKGDAAGRATTDASAPAAATADPTAELDSPSFAAMASRFAVTWTGPGAANDYICVALPEHPANRHVTRAGIREGNPVKIWAPNDPGEYEVRYVLGAGQKVLAKVPLTVQPVSAAVQAPASAKVADWIQVKWEGPAGDGDCIMIARANQNPGSSLDRAAVRQGNPVRLHAPSEPGTYEVRYLLAHANRVLAKEQITVEDVSATLTPPGTAVASTAIDVAWTGPGYPEDVVTIARTDQTAGQSVAYTRVRAGVAARLKAPKEPGVYEARYILGRGSRILAKAPITITAP